MSFFKKFFSKSESNENVIQLPFQKELIPDKLYGKIFIDRIPTKEGYVNCLMYLSSGFSKVGQKEFLLILKNYDLKLGVDSTPLSFFKQIFSYAEAGHFVEHSGITELGNTGLMGWGGILYIQTPNLEIPQIPKDCLSMILLSTEEVQSVGKLGYMRILSLLGKANQYYPFPYWSDLTRSKLSIAEIYSKSILSKVQGSMRCTPSSLTLQGEDLIFTISKSFDSSILPQEILPPELTLSIFPDLSEKADGCLVWSFDGLGPQAITPDNSKGACISGCFLLVLADQEQNIANVLEDGFSLMMTNQTWNEFWQSIIHKKDFIISTSQLNFKLIWQ